MTHFIICIGNRFNDEDAAGLAVYDNLKERDLGTEVEVIEGGIAGLNLLPYLEQGGRIIFVDAVRNITDSGQVAILSEKEIVSTLSHKHYGHEAGLPYLLSVFPRVCDGPLPEDIFLVGIEGEYSSKTIETAACWSYELALNGLKEDM